MKRIRRIWDDRSVMERWLGGLLVLSGILLSLVLFAWGRQLVPWATEWGSVAEWVAAIATALGFAWAVYTLRINARNEEQRRWDRIRAEASNVVLMWERQPERSAYRARIHNLGSRPISEVMVLIGPVAGGKVVLEYPQLGTLFPVKKLDTLLPGKSNWVEYEVEWESDNAVFAEIKSALSPYIAFCFTDVEGVFWLHDDENGLHRGPSKREKTWLQHQYSRDPRYGEGGIGVVY